MEELLREAFTYGQQWVHDINNDIDPVSFNEWFKKIGQQKLKILNIPVVVGQSEQLFCKCKQPDDRSDHEIDRSCFKCGKTIAK